MANFGNFDFSQLKNLQNKLNKLNDPDEFVDACAKAIASQLLKRVIKRTPVGEYPKSSGKEGGTLRRGWEVGKIKQLGNTVYIEVINPVEYAPYVEYGHRTRGGKSWVQGKFMLKISAEEVQSLTPQILEGKIRKYLKELF